MSELYSLPDGWEWKKLDDFVSIKGGKRIPKRKKLLETKTNYPYIRVTDFNDFGSIDLNNIQYITEDIYNEIKNYIISKDDIYISIAGTIGKTGIIPNELDGANLTENAAKFVFDNSKYDKFFLLYFTNSIPFLEQIGLATKTVAMPKLALTRLKEVEIPLPPFEEQKRIVAKLDILFEKIDKAIALHQKNIDEADIFMASVLNDVFEELEDKYGLYELNKVCEFSQGIQVATNQQYESYEDGLNKFIRIINYTQLSNEYRYVKAYSERAFVNENDIVMVRYGATAGFIGRGQKGLIANNLFRVIPNKDYINDFIYFGIKNPKNQSIMFNNIGAAAMPAINFGTMSLLTIPNISISIQQKVVAYLDEISNKMEKIKNLQKKKMQSLKELKASILDKAFKGEL
ncbi:restriction endonuclease subunit S [Aliarcobacter cryaerophilus]|uniref:restriction endonuclease subunit S n=1 Tax=Aliarcobacter cryaerophilus TaxID=28198 RepID=UPI000EB41814|nr:restriction endonuclease subunit S [Aliarcobacter cryaerophilus]AYJ78072.1 type I restriction/modification system, specificity subunit [Aliarcobacter cryaerophilus D2610]